MLTIQSNLKIQDLETLSKTLIKPDIINFGLSKVGGGYTDKIADKVIVKLSKLDKDKTIVIINDITLQMADKLLEAGYKNIYLAFGGFNKDGTVSKDKTVYNIMKAVIENNIKEKLNAISLEEIFNMKIDGIIANPPYSKIGANITYTIREKIDYECFVNLLPVYDYTKWNDIYQGVDLSTLEIITDGFKGDAEVVTSACKICRSVLNIDKTSFEISTFDQGLYIKFFKQNVNRPLGDFSNYDNGGRRLSEWNPNTTFILNDRTPGNKTPFSMTESDKNMEYLWNRKTLQDKTFVLDYTALLKYNKERATKKGKTENHFVGILFDQSLKRKNFTDFIYSKLGNIFMTKILKAMNKNGWVDFNYWLPKVDWSRAWTVEEILIDYGYTEEEIAEVMTDLDNFKGMDD